MDPVEFCQCWDWCTDTLDLRHFRPKTFRHYVFGAEVSWDFCVGAEMFNGTSAEMSRTVRH